MSEWFLRKILRKKLRGFKIVEPWARQRPLARIQLPKRATQYSACYDIFSLDYHTIQPGEKVEFPTDVKVYMRKNEVFCLYPRSNQGIKHDLMLANTTGVIDMDYYENPQNDGSFTIVIRNLGKEPMEIKGGERIAQGMFSKYLVADNDYGKKLPSRRGGVGSTGR